MLLLKYVGHPYSDNFKMLVDNRTTNSEKSGVLYNPYHDELGRFTNKEGAVSPDRFAVKLVTSDDIAQSMGKYVAQWEDQVKEIESSVGVDYFDYLQWRIDIINDLWRSLWSYSVSDDITDGNQHMFAVVDDKNDTLEGVAVAGLNKGALEVVWLASAPKNTSRFGRGDRFKGAGTILLVECAKRAVRAGIDKMQLYSLSGAMGFYAKLGFTLDKASGYMRISGDKLVELANAVIVDGDKKHW